MKRALPALLLGLALGAATTWFATRHLVHNAEPNEPEHTEKPAGHDPLHLDREARERIGLVMGNAVATNQTPEVAGFARVLDPAPLAQQWSDLALSRITASASRKEWERLKILFAQGQNASARALEASDAAFQRDVAAATALEARLLAAWGDALPGHAGFEELLGRLIRFESVLVRIELPVGTESANRPGSVAVIAFDRGGRQTAEWLGPAPSTDPLTQAPAFLALVAAGGLRPGMMLDAFVTTGAPPLHGVLVPSSAVVRHDGGSFVYTSADGEHFARVAVALEHPVAAGWLVTANLTNGQPIVLTGAQMLLSSEFKPEAEE